MFAISWFPLTPVTKVTQDQSSTKPKYRNIQPVSEHQTSKPRKSGAHQRSDDNLDHETIDLTHESKKRIHQSTLLVGRSLLKGVRVSDLKPDTTVRSFSGARADTIGEKLSEYNIDDCKTIIFQKTMCLYSIAYRKKIAV